MNRSVIVFVLLLTMLWQSFGLAHAGSAYDALAVLEHATIGSQGEGHHHHDDGTYHVEDSVESVQHLLADHLTVPLGMLLCIAPSFSPTGSARPGTDYPIASPHPDPDGLFRPPRLTT